MGARKDRSARQARQLRKALERQVDRAAAAADSKKELAALSSRLSRVASPPMQTRTVMRPVKVMPKAPPVVVSATVMPKPPSVVPEAPQKPTPAPEVLQVLAEVVNGSSAVGEEWEEGKVSPRHQPHFKFTYVVLGEREVLVPLKLLQAGPALSANQGVMVRVNYNVLPSQNPRVLELRVLPAEVSPLPASQKPALAPEPPVTKTVVVQKPPVVPVVEEGLNGHGASARNIGGWKTAQIARGFNPGIHRHAYVFGPMGSHCRATVPPGVLSQCTWASGGLDVRVKIDPASAAKNELLVVEMEPLV